MCEYIQGRAEITCDSIFENPGNYFYPPDSEFSFDDGFKVEREYRVTLITVVVVVFVVVALVSLLWYIVVSLQQPLSVCAYYVVARNGRI